MSKLCADSTCRMYLPVNVDLVAEQSFPSYMACSSSHLRILGCPDHSQSAIAQSPRSKIVSHLSKSVPCGYDVCDPGYK